MKNEILKNIFDLQKINSLMKEASSIKEYFQYIKEWSFINGQCEDIIEENKEKINYIYKKNDIDYIKCISNVVSIQMLEKWLKTFGDKKEISSIKIVHSNLENQIEEELLNDYGKRISYNVTEYEILIHYEEYIENLLFYQGILEKRKLKYFFIMLKKNEVEIDTLLYTELPEFNAIMKDINKRIEKYEKWVQLPLIDVTSHTVKKIKCLTTTEVSAAIFHEAIGHLAEKDIYEDLDKNGEVLYKKLSQKQLNVIDIAKDKQINTNIFFDDTGVEAKDTIIISDGILVGIMDDGLGNKRGYCPNGFLRNSCDCEQLQIRMRNLMVKNGVSKYEKIFENLDTGLFIDKVQNSYRIKDVIFLEVKRGLYIKNGKVVNRIEKVVLRSNAFELLKNIDNICDNGKWDKVKKCRKNGGTIYISTYAPSILCKMESINL